MEAGEISSSKYGAVDKTKCGEMVSDDGATDEVSTHQKSRGNEKQGNEIQTTKPTKPPEPPQLSS
jgi:hypothetical protein